MHTVPFKPPKPTHVSQASGKEKYWGEIDIFISSLKIKTKIFKWANKFSEYVLQFGNICRLTRARPRK